MNIVDFVIALPKQAFYDYTLKKIENFLINLKEDDISYKIIGQDYINSSLSGNIYTANLTFKDAIKKSIYGKCLFVPGGKGTLELLNDTLAKAYLNAYDINENTIFLEREAIILFAELNKLTSRAVSKLLFVEESYFLQKGIITIDEDFFIDNNLITTRRSFNDTFPKLIIDCLKNKLY